MGGLRRLQHGQKKKHAASVVRITSRPERRLSEVLLQFAEPLIATARTEEDFLKDVELAILAWNLSLMPADKRSAFLQEALSPSSGREASLPKEIEPFIQMLLARKQALYPDDRRIVIESQISGGPRDGNLIVSYEIAAE